MEALEFAESAWLLALQNSGHTLGSCTCRIRPDAAGGSKRSSKNPSEASEHPSQRPSKDIPAFAEFDRPTRRGSLAMPVAPRRDENPADDVSLHPSVQDRACGVRPAVGLSLGFGDNCLSILVPALLLS